MKSVTPDARRRQRSRQSECLRHGRLRSVESSIETRDLRQVRFKRGQCANRFEVVRLMQRSKRDESVKLFQQLAGNAHRRGKKFAAVHHAMSRGGDLPAGVVFGEPAE